MIGAAINHSGGPGNVPLIRSLSQVGSGDRPVPYGTEKAVLISRQFLWIVNEVSGSRDVALAVCPSGEVPVIVSASYLDRASALKSYTISRLSVSEVAATLVGRTGGNFLHPSQATGLQSKLADKHRGSSDIGCPNINQSLVECGKQLLVSRMSCRVSHYVL